MAPSGAERQGTCLGWPSGNDAGALAGIAAGIFVSSAQFSRCIPECGTAIYWSS